MASPYALPSSALPHAHNQHMHSHGHSQSSMNAWRASMSTGSLPPAAEDDGHDHDHEQPHSHSRQHSHARQGSHTSNMSAMLHREKQPPASLDSLDGWTKETTAGGKSILTPGPGIATTPYSPPIKHNHNHSDHSHHHHHSHDHDHDHDHDHKHDHDRDHSHGHGHGHGHSHAHRAEDSKAPRSLFTRTLLRYTAGFPILHAILVEKDSRRIFYFMV